ncbi:MAG: UDP-glucose/GDP-mannose dehydrogenase family protein [Nitrospirota bacterium]|nr:UDP-glucose/GDP-mannose dehydrogenase family protein [Nitrospirota bacterium]
MHIAVIGSGYVGLVAGAGLSDFGMDVTCVDSNAEKIEALKKGIIPIYEPGLDELVKRNVDKGRLFFSTDLPAAVKQSLVIFIAVGTPEGPDGRPDMSFYETVAKQIAGCMDDYKVIVNKSTVPVGTGAWVRKVIEANQKAKVNFDVVSNPEFLREGSAIGDFMRPDRVVLGVESDQAAAIMKDIYRALYLIETPFVVTNLQTAELIKYASNAFLATKISFINEMANICDKIGGDVHHVSKAMGLDKRIGSKFLHPGPGYGGSCFPKDTKALKYISEDAGAPCHIVDAVIGINERQRERIFEKITAAVGTLKGKTVGVLGIAFKPNTDDIRESPAVDIIKLLTDAGARVKAYDPAAMETGAAELKGRDVEYCDDAYRVADGSDLLVFMTEWNEFRSLDMGRMKTLLKAPVVVDARNICEPSRMKDLGFKYTGVGRG